MKTLSVESSFLVWGTILISLSRMVVFDSMKGQTHCWWVGWHSPLQASANGTDTATATGRRGLLCGLTSLRQVQVPETPMLPNAWEGLWFDLNAAAKLLVTPPSIVPG